MNFLWNKVILGKRKIRMSLYLALIGILAVLVYFTYDEYKSTIVEQQQQNMLATSKSISRSIELFFDGVSDSMKTITKDKAFIESIDYVKQGTISESHMGKIRAYYEGEKRIIDGVYVLDESGLLLTKYPKGAPDINKDFHDDVQVVLNTKEKYIGRAYLDEKKHIFIVNVYEPVFKEKVFKGVVVTSISLDVIYDILINPIKIGQKGYAMVKDQDGIIIMHPLKEQIGIDVIKTRKEVYPELEFKELEKLIDAQLKNKEGVAIYHSYWWGENILKKAKKLGSYTQVKFGDHFWIIALTMSYDEISKPISKFLVKIVGIAITVATIIYMFTISLIKMKKNKEELEKETHYLKMINETSEQLRKKEAELYHSHKLKMIGTFAGGIAHDINNLLTPILGYSELLLMRMDDKNEYYEEVEEIFKASQKGKDLIEQILVVSRNDNRTAKVEAVDINDVTRETIKLLKAVIPKSITIEEKIRENCGVIYASFTQIHQIIFNLCINAYQAISDKKGIISISLDLINKEKIFKVSKDELKYTKYIQISIKDNGYGMNEETKRRLFEPFFTTKHVGDGTGLGLFVVKSIIDKYEGVITVESEVGNGSCFTVYLPIKNEKLELSYGNGVEIEKLNEFYEQKKILLIDDNEEVIKMLEKGLEHLGYKVISDDDALNAISLLKKGNIDIDLVITDYNMPRIKGTSVANKIKQVNKNIPVILITGYMNESKARSINKGDIDAYISKPIELLKIHDIIGSLFQTLNK